MYKPRYSRLDRRPVFGLRIGGKIKKFAKNLFSANRMKMLAMMLLCGTAVTFAQNAAGDYTAGTNALSTVTEEIAKYVPYVVKLCYAIAGVVAVVGAISVYIAMNNWLFWTARNVLKCTDIEQFVKT